MDLLEKMATYVRVVDAGSFAVAAKRSKLTSGAVSRQVAALEAELGLTLIARSTRSMTVTSEGRRYYEHCLRVLREVADAQSMGRARGVEGILRVGAPVSFGLGALMPLLATLRAKHPELRVELQLEDRVLDTSLEGYDVLVRAGATLPITTGVVARKLLAFPFVVVAAKSYLRARGTPTTPEALVNHDALSCHVAPGPDLWELVDGEREARVVMTDAVVFRCAVLQAVRSLALAGQGIALLPDWFVRDDLGSGALRAVLPAWSTEPLEVNALYRTTHREMPRVRAFVEHMVDALEVRPAKARGAR